MKRRNILKAVGAGATIGLAGCTGDNDNSTDGGDGGDGDGGDGDGGDGSDGSTGGTPKNTDTPSYEERIEVNPTILYEQEAACESEGLEYAVDTVYDDTQFVIEVDGFYKTEQKCVKAAYLPPTYNSDAGNVTIRIGEGEEFGGECKSECEFGGPTMRFTDSVEVIFDDTDPDDITVDTFSVVFEYPDGSTSTVVEEATLKEGETNKT